MALSLFRYESNSLTNLNERTPCRIRIRDLCKVLIDKFVHDSGDIHLRTVSFFTFGFYFLICHIPVLILSVHMLFF